MAIENLQTNHARTNSLIYPYTANSVHVVKGVLEMSAAATVASTYDFGLIPPDAIICYYASGFSSDDLATTGSPTLSIGLFGENGSLSDLGYSDDDDCIRSGIALSSANSSTRLIGDIANVNKPVWQLISGVSLSKPVRGPLRVKGTLVAADCDTGGTLLLELVYMIK
jgi:hypothetical protein